MNSTDLRKFNWVGTASGGVFDFDRKDNLIELKDITVPLSKACRYTGATVGHYSVASHTALMARWLRFASLGMRKGQRERSEQAQATLEAFRALKPAEQRSVVQQVVAHDFPEAFVCDVARPVKRHLEPAYGEMEQLAFASIANQWRFLPAKLKDFHEIVWEVDNFILVDEITQILPPRKAGVGVEYDFQLEKLGGPLGVVVLKQNQLVAEVSLRRAARQYGFD